MPIINIVIKLIRFASFLFKPNAEEKKDKRKPKKINN